VRHSHSGSTARVSGHHHDRAVSGEGPGQGEGGAGGGQDGGGASSQNGRRLVELVLGGVPVEGEKRSPADGLAVMACGLLAIE
jgi:hypothetical protein